MPKAIEDFINGETYRAIKGLSLGEMSRYLFTIYSAGYAAGMRDAGGEKIREITDQITAKIAEIKASAATDQEHDVG